MSQSRERFTSEELPVVLSNYDVGIVRRVREFARGSHASAKVLIETDRGRYLLKRRPSGKNDPATVAFAQQLQDYLAEQSFPLPRIVRTRNPAQGAVLVHDAVYEMFEFIDGDPFDGSLDESRDSGRTLGLYHVLVRKFHGVPTVEKGYYHNARLIIGSFPDLGHVLGRNESTKPDVQAIEELVESLRQIYLDAAGTVNHLGLPQWQPQIVHADWHSGNLIFRDHRVSAVLDFDSARVQARVLDVANGCLQFAMVSGGRDLTTWEARTDDRRVREFLAGYDEVDPLSQAELDAVPSLMLEALIAQSIPPIVRTGTFAGLDGYEFLRVVLGKAQWLQAHRDRLRLADSGKAL